MRLLPPFPPAAALIAFALAGGGCGRPAPETRFLNLDPESSVGALTSGWSDFETTPAGDTFVWAQAREAVVAIRADGPADRLIRFRAWPLSWAEGPPQTATVWVNDVQLETIPLESGPRVYSAVSPGPAWKSGGNVLRFEFGWAEAPRDRIPGGGDARTLAVAFDWIEILPTSEILHVPTGPRRP